MIAYTIVTLCLALVGLLVLQHAVKGAPVGYEDEHGFHEGINRQPEIARAMAFEADLHAVAAGSIARGPKEGFRSRKFLVRTLRGSLGHGS